MAIEMIEEEMFNQGTQIKVIGVGGGGGNAVEHMIQTSSRRCRIHLRQHRCAGLSRSAAHKTIQLGATGLGAGSKPDKGREAAAGSKTKSVPRLTARTCCSSPPAWAAAPAPALPR